MLKFYHIFSNHIMIWNKITLEPNFFLQIISFCMCLIETLKISSKSRKYFQLKNKPQHANTFFFSFDHLGVLIGKYSSYFVSMHKFMWKNNLFKQKN